jgi:hypothetical protein
LVLFLPSSQKFPNAIASRLRRNAGLQPQRGAVLQPRVKPWEEADKTISPEGRDNRGRISPFQGWGRLSRSTQGFTLGYFMLPR